MFSLFLELRIFPHTELGSRLPRGNGRVPRYFEQHCGRTWIWIWSRSWSLRGRARNGSCAHQGRVNARRNVHDICQHSLDSVLCIDFIVTFVIKWTAYLCSYLLATLTTTPCTISPISRFAYGKKYISFAYSRQLASDEK